MEKRFEVLKFDDCIVLEVLNGHRKIDAWALMLSPKKAVKNKDKTFLAGRIYHWHRYGF